jgi:hypothetical protein
MAASPAPDLGRDAVVIFALFDIAPAHRAWGWWQFVVGRRRLRSVPGLRFAKLLGSGHEGRFGLKPSASIQGVFCIFDDDASADAFTQDGGLLQTWRSRAREHFCLRLRACSSSVLYVRWTLLLWLFILSAVPIYWDGARSNLY